MKVIEQHREMKNFMTLQMNRHKVDNLKPHVRLRKMVGENKNIQELFGIIYKNRFNTSKLKRDIMKLIKLGSHKRAKPRMSKTEPRSKSEFPKSKRQSKENLTLNVKPSRGAKISKNLKISIQKSVENFGSTTSIDKLFTTKKLVFPPNLKSKSRSKFRKKPVKTPSDNKKFALHLVKQSFMKINKDLLNVRAKANLKLLREKPGSNQIFLNEILKRKQKMSYYETFSNSEDKLELFTSFLERLREMFQLNGYKSESVQVENKKKLKNIIAQNMKLFKESESPSKLSKPKRHVRPEISEPTPKFANAHHGQRLRPREHSISHSNQKIEGNVVESTEFDRESGTRKPVQKKPETEAEERVCQVVWRETVPRDKKSQSK